MGYDGLPACRKNAKEKTTATGWQPVVLLHPITDRLHLLHHIYKWETSLNHFKLIIPSEQL